MTNRMEALRLAVYLLMLQSPSCHGDSTQDDERYRAGKERYELLKKESAMPKYSRCWTDALSSLDLGCQHLSDDIQHRLALKFTNCFLRKTGREVYQCDDTSSLETCTAEMKPEAYNTYTEFFTHTQNICYFLQAQNWQEETENTIEKLSVNSAAVAKQIEDSSELQSEVMKRQNESIKNQEILLERGQQLRTTLEESKVDVTHMIQEFKDSTTEQRVLIFQVFDRLNSLQSMVLGEFTGFYSVIFYAMSVLVCYLLTSTPRTSSARFWLFVLMTANIIVERLLVSWGMEEIEDPNTVPVVSENSEIYRRLWLCRRLFSSLAFLTWIWCAYKYCDYNKINNELLVQIQKQNSDLKHLLQGSSASPKISDDDMPGRLLDNALSTNDITRIESWNRSCPQVQRAIESAPKDNISTGSTPKDNSTTGYESDSDTETGSSDSFNSMMTDRTFTVTHDLAAVSDSDTDSWCTNVSAISLREELLELSSASHLRDISALSDNPSPSSAPKPRRGRPPKGSKTQKTPKAVSSNSPCRYNLRNRSAQSVPNPVVETETAEDFGYMVRQLAKVSERNRKKIEKTLEKSQNTSCRSKSFFSSDEDNFS